MGKKERLEARKSRLWKAEKERKKAKKERNEIIIVKRLSVGLILGVDKNGDVEGVRCYHERKNGEILPCDCSQVGNMFYLSTNSENLRASNKLVVDDSILKKQQLAILFGDRRNRWSPIGSQVFS